MKKISFQMKADQTASELNLEPKKGTTDMRNKTRVNYVISI